MKKRYISTLGVILSLTGCAGDFAQFPPPDRGSYALVVPVGNIQVEHTSNSTGVMFGALGPLIEAAATSSSSQTKGQNATDALAQEKIENYFASQIARKVDTCGIKGQVYKEVIADTDKQWLDKTTSVMPDITSVKANYVIEAGAPEIGISEGMFETVLCTKARVKVYRASDGAYVNKIRDWTCQERLSHYSESDPQRFEELSTKTKAALDKISANLADGICKK
ncbi:MAG: hypothetical protein JO126_04955 [Alphaproteobacteria bacterium]|nr:hypothetical protein [Alphaproteobacteria bacterium]